MTSEFLAERARAMLDEEGKVAAMSTTGDAPCAEGEGASLSRVRAARRHRLIESALQTFLRDGYRGATMDRVAEDACVSKQTLYNYFADKEDLFIALVEEYKTERVLADLQPALAAIERGDLEAGLRMAAEVALCRMDAGHVLFPLYMELATELPELTLRVRERLWQRVFRPSLELFRSALARAAAADRLRNVDLDVATRAILGAFSYSLLMEHFLAGPEPDPLPPQRLAAGLADLLCYGLARAEVKR